MEIRKSQIEQPITNKKDIHMNDVINMFKTEFVIEKNDNAENVKYSKTNSYCRLHYLDIRDHLNIHYLLNILNRKIIKYVNLLNANNTNTYDTNAYDTNYNKRIEKIIYYLDKIISEINMLDKNFNDVKKNKNVEFSKTNSEQKYYLNKIINMKMKL